jgi:hypothetical protein
MSANKKKSPSGLRDQRFVLQGRLDETRRIPETLCVNPAASRLPARMCRDQCRIPRKAAWFKGLHIP